MNDTFHAYAGDGSQVSSRGLTVPAYERAERLEHPRYYLAEKGLRDAVNVALALGQPLLVTGEPGTGKTQLAGSIAWELGLRPPLVFQTKTTSTARDLFYRYDSLRHFHDTQFRRDVLEVENYVTYEALGLSILLSLNTAESDAVLPASLRGCGPTRSVVLIDEIDKAPRDLPNDVLNEIESMSFEVKETGRKFSADQSYRPILVLTSNSEKNLPDAFLRRCVFFHISFPKGERLKKIIEQRLGPRATFSEQTIEQAIRLFEQIRSLPLKKKPATAECLAWLSVLEGMKIDLNDLKPGHAEALAVSYSVLAKSKEDLELLQAKLA